jgi:uncharacterized protein YeaO (DUF488 family)
MIDPEALCWLCNKPGCDAESEVVTVKDQPDSETGFVRVRTEYYHRVCLEEWYKKLIPLHEFRKIEAHRKQELEKFQKNRGGE